MQKPLNSKARNQAFTKFLVFFLLAVIMVCGAVYYDFEVPRKENRLLKEKSEQARTQMLAQEKFTNTLVQVKTMIDSIGKPGVNTIYLNQVVSSKLKDLTAEQFINDSSMQGRMNRAILDVYLDYNKVKADMVSMGDAPNQIADLRSKNDQLQRDLDQVRRDLDLCRKGFGN
jgi:Type VI secretion system, TssO